MDPLLVTPELSDNTNEDVAILRKGGYGVDEDNDPAPKNIPTPAVKDDEVTHHEWVSRSNISDQRLEGHVYKITKLLKWTVCGRNSSCRSRGN